MCSVIYQINNFKGGRYFLIEAIETGSWIGNDILVLVSVALES